MVIKIKDDISLCKWCNCMTHTVKKKSLSASENTNYRYECGKCGCIKTPVEDMINKMKKEKRLIKNS